MTQSLWMLVKSRKFLPFFSSDCHVKQWKSKLVARYQIKRYDNCYNLYFDFPFSYSCILLVLWFFEGFFFLEISFLKYKRCFTKYFQEIILHNLSPIFPGNWVLKLFCCSAWDRLESINCTLNLSCGKKIIDISIPVALT